MKTRTTASECESKSKKVWGYCRVSTVTQDSDRQERDIYEHANRQGWKVKRFLHSTVSSRRGEKERGLGVLRQAALAREVDVIVFAELSRLGRSVGEICQLVSYFVEECMVTLVFVKENMTLAPGKREIGTKVLLNTFSLLAEIERDLISERTRSALAAKRAAGVKLGRPMGKSKLDPREEEIRQWLELGVTQRAICRKVACTEATLTNWLKRKRREWGRKVRD